jgi:IS605 OrfB family transposase
MKLTAKVKLQPTEEQHQSLIDTLHRANGACNYINEVAWSERLFNKFGLQKIVYNDVKDTFGLSAQATIRCISKVTDAYKLDKKTKRTFREDGSIAYDRRILSWKIDQQIVSIWTVDGRAKIPFQCGERAKELLQHQRGESDLCLIDGNFYLFTTCDVDEPEPSDVDEFLGVDLGIKNIAADSDGNTYSGGHVNNLRKRHAKIRQRLQSKGTKSAKRLLRKRKRKEKRFAKNENHRIAKEIVERAKDTGRGIALEELTGIRGRVTVRKSQRRRHHSWSFHDLRSKIEYKAKLHGVPVVAVDPRNTSRTCPCCGCVDKRNRKTQELFSCVSCGYFSNADTNAAINIGRRAAVRQPNVSVLSNGYSQPTLFVVPGTSP